MNKYAPVPGKQRPLTFDDVLALIQAGLLEEGGPHELIDGALYEMPSEGADHAEHKISLITDFIRRLDPDAYTVGPDTTLRLSDLNAPEPDLYVFDAGIRVADLTGPDVKLVVEVSVTRLKSDLTAKRDLYADHGVQEYWVVDIEGAQTHVFRNPVDGVWSETAIFPFDRPLSPAAIPDFAVTIAELPRLKR